MKVGGNIERSFLRMKYFDGSNRGDFTEAKMSKLATCLASDRFEESAAAATPLVALSEWVKCVYHLGTEAAHVT